MVTRRTGLLVDYGGVLTTSPFDSFRAFCESERLAPDTIGPALWADPVARGLVLDLETGALEELEFERRFASILGVNAENLIDRMFAGYHPDEETRAAVLRARQQGVRTGLVSNSWGTRRYDRARLSQLFEAVVISGEVGMRKPAPEIYALAAERIGLEPARCVFVDDLPYNLDPAAELGMATIHHTSAAETVAQLEPLLGVSLARDAAD